MGRAPLGDSSGETVSTSLVVANSKRVIEHT